MVKITIHPAACARLSPCIISLNAQHKQASEAWLLVSHVTHGETRVGRDEVSCQRLHPEWFVLTTEPPCSLRLRDPANSKLATWFHVDP
jgi:hypothetical protein